MDKTSSLGIAYKNLVFLVITIFATITFMMNVTSALSTVEGTGTVDSVKYTMFYLKIRVTNNEFGINNYLHNIPNLPLIPISIGIIYNIYTIIKNHINRNKIRI